LGAVSVVSVCGEMPMRALSTCCARIPDAPPVISESAHAMSAMRDPCA